MVWLGHLCNPTRIAIELGEWVLLEIRAANYSCLPIEFLGVLLPGFRSTTCPHPNECCVTIHVHMHSILAIFAISNL